MGIRGRELDADGEAEHIATDTKALCGSVRRTVTTSAPTVTTHTSPPCGRWRRPRTDYEGSFQ